MISRRAGRVIVVSSNAGLAARYNMSGYAAPKATQNCMAAQLGLEGRDHGVSAFAIHPGNVLTDLVDQVIADPDAQRFIPTGVDQMRRRRESGEDPLPGLARCASLCTALASGRYDSLSGRFLSVEEDLDALLRAG